MPYTPEDVKSLRKQAGLGQKEFGEALGITREMVSYIENGQKPISELVEIKLDKVKESLQLSEIDVNKHHKPKVTGKELRKQKAIGTGEPDEGLIFVPVAAQAGYAAHVIDPVFVNQLERYPIIGLPYKGDRYRIFEVEGDSMTYHDERTGEVKGLQAGFYVITERVDPEHWHQTTQWYVHVVVFQDSVVIKRLYRDVKEGQDSYVLISDNPDYPQRRVKKQDIKEIWIMKRYISWNVPPPKRIEITV